MSLAMNTKNNKGPGTDPFGTPAFESSESMLGFRVMIFNLIFNNISAISLRLVLLLGKARVPGENHRHVASH